MTNSVEIYDPYAQGSDLSDDSFFANPSAMVDKVGVTKHKIAEGLVEIKGDNDSSVYVIHEPVDELLALLDPPIVTTTTTTNTTNTTKTKKR